MCNYKYEIGTRLKCLRKSSDMTQEQLSEKLNISQKHYSEVERGLTGLSLKSYIELSDIFSVSLDYLIKGTIAENKNSPVNNQLIELYYSSSKYTQKQMLRLMSIMHEMDKHKNKNNSTDC